MLTDHILDKEAQYFQPTVVALSRLINDKKYYS